MSSVPYILRELFFRHIAQTSPYPFGLEIEKAEGVFLYGPDGGKIIDLISGVSVSNVGHANKEVIDAVKAQIELYMHLMVYGELIQAPQVEHATLLTSCLPENLNSVYYVNSGSEANEAAVKLAKRVTGRREIVSCYNCYHGSTQGVMSLMSDEELKRAFRPLLPGISHINFNNFDDLRKITEKSAAVIIEPVQGEAGVILPVEGYLEALRQRCNEVGALLIFDEVQTGFGRCGKLFAFQKYGVIPDIITLAKALGGGMPLGAFIASGDLMESWQFSPALGHITTFGGHPVSCAAALASLKVLLKEPWVDEVEGKSQRFVKYLRDHPLIKEIRAAGLLIAVELGESGLGELAVRLLLKEGVMSDWFLSTDSAFRIAPPLCINDAEIDYAVEKILKVLDKIFSEKGR
ncbi:MAG TPA: aspartate aminotransferase family protein [Bacteroidales bacterium]|nr:aspartate aminotransferase family protein [Bacteroidales bacterium]HRT33294.1 aspartate aminotransferase family protein [Bacteroidales bacterium]